MKGLKSPSQPCGVLRAASRTLSRNTLRAHDVTAWRHGDNAAVLQCLHFKVLDCWALHADMRVAETAWE